MSSPRRSSTRTPLPGRPRSVSSTWVESETLIAWRLYDARAPSLSFTSQGQSLGQVRRRRREVRRPLGWATAVTVSATARGLSLGQGLSGRVRSGEARRNAAMLSRDLGLVGAHEPALAHHVLARDHEPLDAVRAAEDEARNRVVGARELEAVGPPDGEVRALARLQRPELVALQHRRAPPRAEPQRLACR